MARISLMLTGAHSLKEKRMVIRRIKDRVRERLGIIMSEVGTPEVKDSWQRSELGVAVASGDRQKALAVIDGVIRVAMAAGGAEIIAVAKDSITFDAEASPFTIDPIAGLEQADDRTGSADKAVGGDDWVPDAWREDS
jgi:uncharacterized protein YlxP (DUF503 family)